MNEKFEPGDQRDGYNFVCPYCGMARKSEPCDGDARQEPMDEDCEECGKTFTRYAVVSVDYVTHQKEGNP